MKWVTLEHEGKRWRVAVARDAAGVWIGWPGGAALFQKERQFAAESLQDDAVRAPMTAKVVSVAVQQGDAVVAEQLLVVLEAMKMEYRLTAPKPGTVEAVLCQAGELVDLGATLIRLKQ